MGETAERRAPIGSCDVRTRPHLLWLLVPYVLYLGAVPLVNRVQPTVAGVPFLFFWLFAATLLTPPLVWLAYRGDRKRERGRDPERRRGQGPLPGGQDRRDGGDRA